MRDNSQGNNLNQGSARGQLPLKINSQQLQNNIARAKDRDERSDFVHNKTIVK